MNYEPKDWQTGEIITEEALDHIEQGIKNLEQYLNDNLETIDNAADNIQRINEQLEDLNELSSSIQSQTQDWITTRVQELNASFEEQFNNYNQAIQSIISSADENFNTKLNISDVYGVNEINNEGKGNLKEWIESELGELSSAIESNIDPKLDIIGNILGPAYYDNNTWITSSEEDSIDIRLNMLHNAIYGEVSSSEEPSSSLIDQLEQLNTAIFGSSEDETISGSLIDKIETAIGRDLEPTAAQIVEDADLNVSLYELIKSIKGTLGMPGGTSGQQNQSSLIDDVNTALNLLYGYTYTRTETENPEDLEHPIITETYIRNAAPNLKQSFSNSYPILYNNFYNAAISYNEPVLDNNGNPVLDENDNPTYTTITQTGALSTLLANVYSRIGNVDSTNAYLMTLLSNYNNLNAKAINSYEAAETSIYDDNTYLILKRDRQATLAENISDFSETGEYNGSTYIQLPKGGGGGTEYTNIARFTNVVYPANTSLVIGDECNITFTWSVTDDASLPVPLVGNLTIRIGGSTVYSTIIDANTSITYNLGQYINSSGRNNITITVTNATVVTRTLYVTLTAYQATLTSLFNENEIQTNSSIEYSYLASIGSNIITKVLHIEIDGVAINLSNNETLTETQNSVIFTTPSAGSHLMKVWFTAQISETITITSQALYYGIICGSNLNTVIATNFVNGTNVERYSTLIIHYLVSTPNQNSTKVEFFINNNITPIRVLDVPPTYQDWSYSVTNGTGPLTITIKANGVEKILTANVTDESHYDLSMVTTGLKLYFTADQRSNNSSNANVWTNSAGSIITNTYQEQIDQINPNEAGISNEEKAARQARIAELQSYLDGALVSIPSVIANMENFLFYRTIDGWQQDNDGAYFLRLRNQNKVTIPFSIFGSNIAETGATFEIDFKTQDVADYDARIIQCFEGQNFAESTKNILLTAQNAIINNVKGLTTQYKEEEKITLTFVINTSRPNEGSTRTASKTDGLLYIYINGVLSAATPYQELGANAPNLEFTNNSTAKIVLGSPDCTLDLYSIKYYNRALNYKEIIKNWIFNTGNFNEKIDRFMRNNYTTLSVQQFIDNSRTTPYMIITGAGPLNDPNAMPQQKGSSFKKTIDVEYVDPVNPEYSFTANSSINGNFTGKAEAQVQGTSSQAYFRKNYKIKLSSFTQNGIFHIKSPTDDYYDIEYDNTTTPPTEISRTLKENVTKNGYKLSENSYPEFTFCIKADVASSESVNNTGLTMIYDEVARKFMATPPQYDDNRIRQGVEGYPMVVWYRDSINGTETLLGKYNFNNDKGTAKVYGLKTDLKVDKSYDLTDFSKENGIYDESWEVKNNDAGSLVMFEVPGTTGSAERNAAWLGYTYTDNKVKVDSNGNAVLKWQDSFESRFPDQDDEGIALINPNASTTSGEINIEQSSQNDISYLNKRLAGLREMVEWVNDTVVWTDSSKTSITSASASAFKAGFENYFNLNALLFFYNFTELFLMVDSRAKNMFWTRYQVRDGVRPKTSGYDQNINTLAPDNFKYFGWFTLPYDFDTALGINNQGKNVYDYHWESSDVTGPEGSAIFGGQYSKLWVAFRQVYANEIAANFQQISADINYNKVENLFERNQSIWSETIVNEDMIAKYIDWAADIGYDMLLGLKDMQRKWWLWNRFKYFNSKYAIERGTDNINIRVHVNNANIPVQVYADSYISLNVGANGTPTTIRVLRGQTGYLTGGSDSNINSTDSSGIETYISPASALKSVQNLSTLKISSIDVSKAIRLQELQIGTPNYEQRNELLRSANVAPTEGYSSLLRFIDFRNCINLGKLNDNTPTPTLNVSGCLFLNRIYLAGTPLHIVNLPNGGVIKTIQYPTTIKEIKIENQPYLENLIIGAYLPADEITNSTYEESDINHVNDYSNITTLILNNIGEAINVPYIIHHGSNITTCQLSNLTFRMSGQEFESLFNKLVNMEDNCVVTINNCKLYLSSDLPTMTINEITSKYDFKIYDKDGNEYLNIKFYDFNRNLIKIVSIPMGSSNLTGPNYYFTDTYLDTYNGINENNYAQHNTRIGFGGWDYNLANASEIITDLDINPVPITQYRIDFVSQTSTGVDKITYRYFTPNAEIIRFRPDDFEKNYYLYFGNNNWWTTLNNRVVDYFDNINDVVFINSNATKAAEVETWYAAYQRQPQLYEINLYNTNINGEAVGESLLSNLKKPVIGTGNKILPSDISSYLPTLEANKNTIYMAGTEGQNDAGKIDSERQYRFLTIRPYIPSGGLQVTGNMNLYITYYNIDDIFTNYFLNKLTNCNLGDISSIPPFAFNHNTNLEKLYTSASTVGAYSFATFNNLLDTSDSSKKRYFVFDNVDNLEIKDWSFYYLNNSVIIFTGTGNFKVTNNVFNYMQNSIIILLNTTNTITCTNLDSNFYGFIGNNNYLYVTNSAFTKYPTTTGTNQDVPYALISENRTNIRNISVSANKDIVNGYLREVGLQEVE